jgi:acyl-CoA synthetase (AMP-forming)/AMP-acid ligase II
VFISGGENIDPVEVETQLLHHAALLGARVIGVPHDRWGMRPAAFVRTDGSALDWDALVASLGERLPRHALPDAIVEWPGDLPHKGSLAQCHAALPSARVLWSRPAPERSAVGEPADGVGHGD